MLENLKRRYRKELLKLLLADESTGDSSEVRLNFWKSLTIKDVMYSAARKLYTQLSRAHECTCVYTCEHPVIAANMSRLRNAQTLVVREIVCTRKWLRGETR